LQEIADILSWVGLILVVTEEFSLSKAFLSGNAVKCFSLWTLSALKVFFSGNEAKFFS